MGTLRLHGLFSRSATAEAGGARWRLARRGVWGYPITATDDAGAVVGTFEKRTLRRGGTLRWNGRELALRPDGAWRERYVLADGERELAAIEGKGWGKRPVKVTVGALAASDDPGLLLFAAFVVRAVIEDVAAAAGAAPP